MLFMGGHLWFGLNLLTYVPFYSQYMDVLTIMLIFDQELARSTDITLTDIFIFHLLFCSRLVMK